MKFLLDENFPKSVAWGLKEKGHEVLDLRSVGLLGASDTVVAEMAINEGAMILTTDRDFLANVCEEHWKNRVFQLRDSTWLAKPPVS